MFGKSKEKSNTEIEIFTVFDSKAATYDFPAFAPNKNTLMRDVINMLKDPQQSKNKYLLNAEDYAIFKIGSFDKLTGLLTSQNLEHVANMHDLRAMAEPDRALSPT